MCLLGVSTGTAPLVAVSAGSSVIGRGPSRQPTPEPRPAAEDMCAPYRSSLTLAWAAHPLGPRPASAGLTAHPQPILRAPTPIGATSKPHEEKSP